MSDKPIEHVKGCVTQVYPNLPCKCESKNRPEWEDEATLKTRIGLQAWAFVQSLFVAYQQLRQENERLKQENKELNRKIMEYLKIENLRILIVDAQDKKIADLTAKLEAYYQREHWLCEKCNNVWPFEATVNKLGVLPKCPTDDSYLIPKWVKENKQQADRIRTLESLYRKMRLVAGAQEHHSGCALKRKTGTVCDCHQKSIWVIDVEFDRIRAALDEKMVKP